MEGAGGGLVLAVDLAVETESLLAGQLVQEPCTVLVTYGLALSPKTLTAGPQLIHYNHLSPEKCVHSGMPLSP